MWWIVLVLTGLLLEARYHFVGAQRNDQMMVPPGEEQVEQEGFLLRLGEWYKLSVIVNGDFGRVRSIDRVAYSVP